MYHRKREKSHLDSHSIKKPKLPYITNQKINAPFPKDKDIESIELKVALEIIAAKKAKGPTKFRRRKK